MFDSANSCDHQMLVCDVQTTHTPVFPSTYSDLQTTSLSGVSEVLNRPPKTALRCYCSCSFCWYWHQVVSSCVQVEVLCLKSCSLFTDWSEAADIGALSQLRFIFPEKNVAAISDGTVCSSRCSPGRTQHALTLAHIAPFPTQVARIDADTRQALRPSP
jgi:hypothetical protein